MLTGILHGILKSGKSLRRTKAEDRIREIVQRRLQAHQMGAAVPAHEGSNHTLSQSGDTGPEIVLVLLILHT